MAGCSIRIIGLDFEAVLSAEDMTKAQAKHEAYQQDTNIETGQ